MPVLLATDPNTDMGRIAEENGFGLWSLNGDLEAFMANMNHLAVSPKEVCYMGNAGKRFLLENYTVDKIAGTILISNNY